MENEDILTDLSVISMLQENGRLCIRNGHLSIEPQLDYKENVLLTWSSYASLAIRRWWNQDNRQNALLKVQSIIMKCYELLSRLKTDEEKKEFANLCTSAANGLKCLQQTYSHDAAVCARLSVYIKNLCEIVSQ